MAGLVDVSNCPGIIIQAALALLSPWPAYIGQIIMWARLPYLRSRHVMSVLDFAQAKPAGFKQLF